MLSVIVSNAPAGAATKQLIHYAQEIRSGMSTIEYIRDVNVMGAYL